MKLKIFLVLLMSMFINSAEAQWTKYTSKDNLFTISSPCQMEEKSKELETGMGTIILESAFCEPEEDNPNYLYLVNTMHYQAGAFPSDSTDLIDFFLGHTITEHALNLGGTVDYTSDDDFKGFPSRLSRISYNDGQAICKTKLVLIGDTMYSIQVFTLVDKSLNEEMDTFLQSFTPLN